MTSSWKPVAVAWALAAVVTTAPYLVAALDPPPGRAFAGAFHWIDDVHNYLSFAQQAEDGRVVFGNKLLLEAHAPSLVNLEWLVVGWISRACGREPFLAFRIVALLALAGLLSAGDRALARAGLPASHRLAALLLVAFGGGLGGLLFEFTERPAFRSADLYVGFHPFLEALANPHWLVATWLLLETLLALGRGGSPVPALVLGTALGLVRPYDLALAGLAHALAVVAAAPRSEWLRRALPLASLAPVALYNYVVFYRGDTFRTFGAGGTAYASPPASDLLWSLGPAAVLAALGARRSAPTDDARMVRAQLWAWAAAAIAIVAARPVAFSLQFAVGAGLPLLLLGALALARVPAAAAVAAALAFSTSAVVATRIVLRPDPHWHVPAERVAAARMLRAHCRPGDLVFAPPDVGLYALPRASCRPFVSHPWEPDHAAREEAAAAFYGPLAPHARTAILDRLGARHVVLPGDAGPAPAAWLGAGTPFRKVAQAGEGPRALSLYVR